MSFIDISATRKAKRDLVESEGNLRLMAKTAKVGSWEYIPQKAVFRLSEEALSIHGIGTEEEISAEILFSLYGDADRQLFSERLNEAEKTQICSFDMVLELNCEKHEKKWIRITGCPPYPGSNDDKISGIIQDISELKNATDTLRASEENFRILFETMPQGVVFQGSNGEIISANQAACRILGLTSDQITGRTSSDPEWKAIKPDGSTFPGSEHPSMTALATGKIIKDVVMGIHNPAEASTKWINITAVPLIRNNEKEPYSVYTTFTEIG